MPRARKVEDVTPIPTTPTSSMSRATQIDLLCNNLIADVLSMFGPKEIYEKLAPEVEKVFREQFGCIPQIHKALLPDGSEHSFTGVTHEMFDTVMNLVNLDIPVYLAGPAGSGNIFAVYMSDHIDYHRSISGKTVMLIPR